MLSASIHPSSEDHLAVPADTIFVAGETVNSIAPA
jgi:hypothetical protein